MILEKIKTEPDELDLKITADFADAEKTVRTKLEAHWNIGGKSRGKVVAIGINPGTAGQNGNSDRSVTRLTRFLDMYGFDNVTIINLFENVSSDSVDPKLKNTMENYRKLFESAKIILVAWGTEKNKHTEQKTAACRVLEPFNEKLYCIQSCDGRFPRHMRVIEYEWEIQKCSVRDLL